MICSRCKRENVSDANFCEYCGAKLQDVCSSYKNLFHLNTTTKQQDFQPTADKARLCAACGLPMVGDMYELADGRLIHHSDDCLQKAAGIYACYCDRYPLAQQQANAMAWLRVHKDSDQGVALC